MTRGKLTIETGDVLNPVEVFLDVQTDDQTVTITVTPTEVQVHTKNKPEITPTSAQGQLLTEFKDCEECEQPILVMLSGQPPKTCKEHN